MHTDQQDLEKEQSIFHPDANSLQECCRIGSSEFGFTRYFCEDFDNICTEKVPFPARSSDMNLEHSYGVLGGEDARDRNNQKGGVLDERLVFESRRTLGFTAVNS